MNNVLKNWNASRIIRLLLGVGIAIYAISVKEPLFLIVAGVFLLQGVLNISCCGTGRCSTPRRTSLQVYKDEIKEFKP